MHYPVVLIFQLGVSQWRRQVWQALPVDLPRNRLHEEFFDKEDPRRDRRRWKLFGQRRCHPSSPLHRCGSDHRDLSFADRRCGNKGDQHLVLVIQNGSLDLTELGLEDILNGLRLDAMPAHLELRVDSTEEVHALGSDVDFAFIRSAVEAAELRVRDELLGGLLRQVSVPACDVHPTDTELSNLPVGQWSELVDLEDDVGNVGKWRANGNGLPWAQALAARIGARLCWTIGVDDLASGPGPRLHERAGEGFARGDDVATQRIGEI